MGQWTKRRGREGRKEGEVGREGRREGEGRREKERGREREREAGRERERQGERERERQGERETERENALVSNKILKPENKNKFKLVLSLARHTTSILMLF